MSSVWDMLLQWGSTIKVIIELPVTTKHRRDMTEKLLKATLNPNSPTHTHTRIWIIATYNSLFLQSIWKIQPSIYCFRSTYGCMFGYICLFVGVLLELGERSGKFGGKLSICVFVCVYVCLSVVIFLLKYFWSWEKDLETLGGYVDCLYVCLSV